MHTSLLDTYSVCVCACVRVCMRVCVRVCMRVYTLMFDMYICMSPIAAYLTELVHGIVGKYVYNFQPFLTQAEASTHTAYECTDG